MSPPRLASKLDPSASLIGMSLAIALVASFSSTVPSLLFTFMQFNVCYMQHS